MIYSNLKKQQKKTKNKSKINNNYIPTASVLPKTEEKLLSLTKAAEELFNWFDGAACDEIPLLNPRKFNVNFFKI